MSSDHNVSVTPASGGSLKGFWALIVTQFQGAFNDNLFKWVIVYFVFQKVGESQVTVSVATMLFSLPFILIPAILGAMSDKFSKRRVTIWTKYLEVFVMSLGFVAFVLGSEVLIWMTLFLMATQSAIFSPAKYGMLPEILPDEKLSWGNGILQLGTFMAIIMGTAVAGPLVEKLGDNIHYASLSLIVLSLIGLATAHGITKIPAANPEQRIPRHPWDGMGKHFRILGADRWLLMTVLALTFFWFVAALVQQNVLHYGFADLEVTKTQSGFMQASLALGIGLGSLLAGYLSGNKVEVGLVPLGALGIALCCAAMAFFSPAYQATTAVLFLLGASSGFYVVPLSATLQKRSPDEAKGGIIATANFLSFTAILIAGGLTYAFAKMGIGSSAVFAISAVLTLAVTAYICWLLPVALIRFIVWCLMHTFYRIRVPGHENVPEKGGALLVANHMSFIDAVVILTSIDRPVRCVISQDMYENRFIRFFAKASRAIPISATGKARDLVESLSTARDALASGDLVCVFAEGEITRTGQMLHFKKGFERIIKGLDIPIIPVHLDRLWGSVFSYSDQKFFWKIPRSIPYHVTVGFGKPMPPDTTADKVREVVQELGSEAASNRPYRMLQRSFVRRARRRLFKPAVMDAISGELNFFKTLVGTIVIGMKLKRVLDDQEKVGVLLPTTVGAALTNVSLTLMGKVAVNLNYTTSKEGIHSAARRCKMTHVVTSKAFLERLPIDVPGKSIFLEDIKLSITAVDRVFAMVLALFCPVRLLEYIMGSRGKRSVEDLVTVIFSSGSEGEPKGVMLTHKNIQSNFESALQVVPHTEKDRFIGILPMFHSFGYMALLWLPISYATSVVYYPNPLDAKMVGEMVNKYKATLMVSAPTFLMNFIRKCTPESFESLRIVITGAEKLPERTRLGFKERFGIEPLEAYGVTETSPAVSINVPDFQARGFFQRCTKHGTVGRPIPGVCVRVVDPETGEQRSVGEQGMLLVKGPNVMKGYLDMPERTASVLKDGWYTTGDIAFVDEEGFITITDRLSRFSKIAGEMIPHTKIEETLHTLVGSTEQVMAVTGVPDASKGERLIVLHTLSDEQLNQVIGKLSESGLPNLWQPKPNSFFPIEEIPLLGTGKLDLGKVKAYARELTGEEA